MPNPKMDVCKAHSHTPPSLPLTVAPIARLSSHTHTSALFSQDIKLLFKRMHHFFYGDKDPGTVKEQVAAAQAAATGTPAPAPLVVDPKKEVILPLETVGSVYKNPIPGEPPVVVK